jgi:eIF4-gamma/eIF5/eIF2-epsilon
VTQAAVLAALSAAALSGGDALPLLKALPLALNCLYDADAIAEDAVLLWVKGADALCQKAAAPFIEWLKTADEDDEDDA